MSKNAFIFFTLLGTIIAPMLPAPSSSTISYEGRHIDYDRYIQKQCVERRNSLSTLYHACAPYFFDERDIISIEALKKRISKDKLRSATGCACYFSCFSTQKDGFTAVPEKTVIHTLWKRLREKQYTILQAENYYGDNFGYQYIFRNTAKIIRINFKGSNIGYVAEKKNQYTNTDCVDMIFINDRLVTCYPVSTCESMLILDDAGLYARLKAICNFFQEKLEKKEKYTHYNALRPRLLYESTEEKKAFLQDFFSQPDSIKILHHACKPYFIGIKDAVSLNAFVQRVLQDMPQHSSKNMPETSFFYTTFHNKVYGPDLSTLSESENISLQQKTMEEMQKKMVAGDYSLVNCFSAHHHHSARERINYNPHDEKWDKKKWYDQVVIIEVFRISYEEMFIGLRATGTKKSLGFFPTNCVEMVFINNHLVACYPVITEVSCSGFGTKMAFSYYGNPEKK